MPNLNYRTGDHPDWQNITGPNLRTGEPEVNPFTIKFVDPQTAAAFNAIAQPPTPTTITAKLNGEVVESFETEVTITNGANFFGFTGIEFDEIEVEYTAATRMRIDNLQLGQLPKMYRSQSARRSNHSLNHKRYPGPSHWWQRMARSSRLNRWERQISTLAETLTMMTCSGSLL